MFVCGSDDVKTAEEPGTEAELLKAVEVVDEVKTEEAEGKTTRAAAEQTDASTTSHVDDADHVKNDEQAGELAVDVDKDSKQALCIACCCL